MKMNHLPSMPTPNAHHRGEKCGLSRRGVAAALAALLALPVLAAGQGIDPRFDVTSSIPIKNSDGNVLPGNNPEAGKFGLPTYPGTLIQLILVGPNGAPDLPQMDGSPGGDDMLFASTVVGQGMAPNVLHSGRFSTSFYPPPPQGSRVYVRAFNAPTLAAATRWGQSNPHTVRDSTVFDAAVCGLWATTQPKGTDPYVTDTDGDGLTDYQELLANTNADDDQDALQAEVVTEDGRVEISGRAGRGYQLLRSTNDFSNTMDWEVVALSGTLSTNRNLVLQDPEPVASDKAFYRVEAVYP